VKVSPRPAPGFFVVQGSGLECPAGFKIIPVYSRGGVELEKIIDSGGFRSLVFEPWLKYPGLVQGVTVRPAAQAGGVTREVVAGRFRREGFRAAPRIKQVHGSRVVEASSLSAADTAPEADGVASAEAGVLGLLTIADCVPVFVLDPHRRAWALVHAGWRGTVAGALESGIARLAGLTGSSLPAIEVYLGPAVCGNCYEVGPEVADALGRPAAGAGIAERDGRITADLRAILGARALALGIPPANLHSSGYCTICHNELFSSYRAEGKRALKEMWAFLGWKNQAGP